MEHHGAALRRLTKDDELVAQLKATYAEAKLSSRHRSMLDYAVKLTSHPADMGEADIAALRNQGFDDREILDICQVTSYFNFVTRMASGLGVELENK